MQRKLKLGMIPRGPERKEKDDVERLDSGGLEGMGEDPVRGMGMKKMSDCDSNDVRV